MRIILSGFAFFVFALTMRAAEPCTSVFGVATELVANGSLIADALALGAAPTAIDSASVSMDGVEILSSDVATTQTLNVDVPGNHSLVQTIGDVSLEANYIVEGCEDDGVVVASAMTDLATCADGVCDAVPLGNALSGDDEVSVLVNGAPLEASEVSNGVWRPSIPGNYIFTCRVGDVEMSANYVVVGRDVSEGVVVSSAMADVVVAADGDDVEGSLQIGYSPHGKTNAVVAVNGEEIVNSDVEGTLTWRPTESGDYTLTHTVGDVVLSATYHVNLPMAWSHLVSEDEKAAVATSKSSTYNGYLYDDEETPVGTIQAKVAKARLNWKTRQWSSSVTVAILIAGEKKISLRGTVSDDGEAVSLVAKDGRVLKFWLGANGLSGTFGDYVIDGARDVFSSKATDDKTRANEALAQWKGALAIASDVGTFSVTISAKGKVRITGVLADGTKISTSAQMIVGETCSCIPVVVSTKSVNLAFCIWLGDNGETVEVVGLGEEVVCGRPGALADGAAFRIDAAALCELLGDDTFAAYLPDGVSVAQKGTKWIVANGARTGRVVLGKDGNVDEVKAGANPSGLKLAYKAKDGSFSGSFKAYVLYRGKPKSTTVTVSGVVIDGVGYGTATIRKVGSVAVRIE